MFKNEFEKVFKTPLKIDWTPHTYCYTTLKSYANCCSDKARQRNLEKFSEYFRDGGLLKIKRIPPKKGEVGYGIAFENQADYFWLSFFDMKETGKILKIIFDRADDEKLSEKVKNSIEENREVFLQIKQVER